MTKTGTIRRGVYQHYKGKNYEVLGIARHSETVKAFVVYKALYKTDYGRNSLWIRPLEMFTEHVLIGGQRVPRFRYMGRADKHKK